MYKGKVVVITGGSGGIGATLVEGYLALNAQVFNLDINTPSAHKNSHLSVDLSDEAQVIQAFDKIFAQYGAVHILINNGAIPTENGATQELSSAEFAKVIGVNLVGAFSCAREFAKANQGESFGRIINIASTRWQQNESGWDAYGASKGGLVSLTQSLVNSLAQTPITINTISPGWIETVNPQNLRPEDHAQHPSRRVGKPKDILNACLFLTDTNNDFINGANLVIDGGMSKKMMYLD